MLEIGDYTLQINDKISNKGTFTNEQFDNFEQNARLKAVDTIEQLLKNMKFNEKDMVKIILTSYVEYLNTLNKTNILKILSLILKDMKEALNMTNEGEKQIG